MGESVSNARNKRLLDRLRTTRFKYLALLACAALLVWMCFVDANPPPPPHNCAQQMAKIDEAITKWAVANRKGLADVPTEADLVPYIGDKYWLVCPHHGRYQFGTSIFATTCSIHGHAILTPTELKPSVLRQLELNLHLVKSFGYAPVNTCIANLKMLDGAVQQWAFANRMYSNSIPTFREITPYLGKQSLCPSGGKYVISAVSAEPVCTVIGHSL